MLSRLRLLTKFPEKWKGGRLEKIKDYFYNIYADYKQACVDVIKDSNEQPIRATIYISSLISLFVLYKTNPTENDHREALTDAANEMLLIGKDIRNPQTDAYLSSLLDAVRDKRLRYRSLLFLSLVYFDTASSESDLFESRCKLVKPHWTEFHKHVADVGVFNRFIYLKRAMVDYDVNTDEWKEDGMPRSPIQISQLIKNY